MKWIIGTALALVAILGGTVAAQAATAQQTVVFSVPSAVSITSGGDVNFGSVLAGTTATKNGTFTLVSNDTNGFDITASTPAATVTETATPGPCAPSTTNTMAASTVVLTGSAVTGGTGTQPGVGMAHPLSTTATSIFGTHPNVVGSGMGESVQYSITLPATQPPNNPGCGFVFPISFVMTGL